MSAPQTNLEKQKRWHRAPLLGMLGGIIFVGLMFLWLTGVFSPTEKVVPLVEGTTAPTNGAASPQPADAAAPAVPATPAGPAPVAPAGN